MWLFARVPSAVAERVASWRGIAGNVGWQCADSLVRMIAGLLLGVWLARYLGPDRYGALSYALSFASLFTIFAPLGLDDIIVRDAVRFPGRRGELLGSAALLRLLAAGLSIAAAVCCAWLLRAGDLLNLALVAIIAGAALGQAPGVIEFWFHSRLQARRVILAKGGAFAAGVAARIALIVGGAALVAFAWVTLAEALLAAFGLVVAYRLAGERRGEWRVSLAAIKELLRDGWPLMMASALITGSLRIDQVMLGELAGPGEVGIYAVAVRLAEVWFFIPTALYWSIFPGIVAARGEGEAAFYRKLQGYYRLVALCSYSIIVPVTLLAKWLVPLLFGPAYAGGGAILAVMIWSNLFIGLEMARGSFLNAMNWTRLYLVTAGLGCLANIVLNWLLIPRYGGMGAALATVVSYWFAAHGTCLLFRPLWQTGRMLTRAILWPWPFSREANPEL